MLGRLVGLCHEGRQLNIKHAFLQRVIEDKPKAIKFARDRLKENNTLQDHLDFEACLQAGHADLGNHLENHLQPFVDVDSPQSLIESHV